jgi:competence protein ComEC
VFGIVSIQPWVYEKWRPKTWLMNEIWLIVSVSIAAQLATFPLGLFYFHQFPNYFLLSNLIVIPVSTIILGYGLLMFVLGKISAIGITCGKIFSFFVWILNESVRITDETPGSLIQGISPSILETGIIYLLVIFLIVFIYKKQMKYFFISLSTIIISLTFQTIEAHSIRKQKAIIVYDIPKISAYDFINGKQTLFLADSSLLHNQSGMKFHIKQNWWNRNVANQKTFENEKENIFSDNNFSIRNNFIQFENKRIVVVKELPAFNPSINQKLKVDIIILSKNAKIEIQELQKWYEFKKIIFDSSNSKWKIEKWKKECVDLKIDFYSVNDLGAYIEEI